MQKKLVPFVLLLILFPECCYTQNLYQACLDYYLNPHFFYQPSTISLSKIKFIEKHQYTYSNDTINHDFLLEKHQFNQLGKPEYVYKKPIGMEKSEFYYSYDSIGNLIKEERYGIAPSLQYKLEATHEWFYSNQILTQHRYYQLCDNFPLEHGAAYFPEKIFLYEIDSIRYNQTENSVLVLSNYTPSFSTIKAEPYPPNFKTSYSKTLTFHPNNRMASYVLKRDQIVQTKQFDECGNAFPDLSENKKCQELRKITTACLAPDELNICNQADTITINKILYFYVQTHFSNFVHDSGAGTSYENRGTSYYDQNFRQVRSIDTCFSQRGSMWENIPNYTTQTIRNSQFEYFENGLLKKITVTDELGKMLEVTEFKIEYY